MNLKKILLNEQSAGQTYTVRSEVVTFENAKDKRKPELAIGKGTVFTKSDTKLIADTNFNFRSSFFGTKVQNPDGLIGPKTAKAIYDVVSANK